MAHNYEVPNTNLYLFSDVPLDPTYEHTIYWDSNLVTRDNYFQNQSGDIKANLRYTLSNQSYQRLNRGWIRVTLPLQTGEEISANATDRLRVCNYLCFQNTNFKDENAHSQWYYCFIKTIKYINNNVAEIEYEIDVMTTWFNRYQLGRCFVEREHSATDTLFENTLPENIEIGDTYYINDTEKFDLNDMQLVILYTVIVPSSMQEHQMFEYGAIRNGIYTPLKIAVENIPDPNSDTFVADMCHINYLIHQAIGTQNIVAIYQCPTKFFPDRVSHEPIEWYLDLNSWKPTNHGTLAGHSVRNNKLFCYPYNLIMASNNSGQTGEYHFENWNDINSIRFDIRGVCVTQPVGICYPHGYRKSNIGVGGFNDYEDGITISNFPVCAWQSDVFAEWWAQNKNSFMTSNLTSVLTTVGGGALGLAATALAPEIAIPVMAAGAGLSVASTVANSVAKVNDLKATAPQVRGQAQTDCLNGALKRYKYDFYHLCIKPEYLEMCDAYFDRYGYLTNANKYPNRNVRPHWTYTKTLDCVLINNPETVLTSVPTEDLTKIAQIYNNGITFWKNPNEVGNYNLDNRTT